MCVDWNRFHGDSSVDCAEFVDCSTFSTHSISSQAAITIAPGTGDDESPNIEVIMAKTCTLKIHFESFL